MCRSVRTGLRVRAGAAGVWSSTPVRRRCCERPVWSWARTASGCSRGAPRTVTRTYDVRCATREEALGIALTGAVNLLDPEGVVLGGALAGLAPWLLPSLEAELARRTAGPACPVAVSRLGPEGPLLGAAHSVVRAVLDDPAAVAERA